MYTDSEGHCGSRPRSPEGAHPQHPEGAQAPGLPGGIWTPRRHLDSQEASAWFASLSPKDLPSCHHCDLEAALQGAPQSWELDPWGGPCPSPVPARPLRPAWHFLCPLLFLLPPFLTVISPHSSASLPFSSPLFPLPCFFIPVSLPPCLVFITSLSPLLLFLAPSTCSNVGFFLLSPEARV